MDPTISITKAEITGDVTPAIKPESVEKEREGVFFRGT